MSTGKPLSEAFDTRRDFPDLRSTVPGIDWPAVPSPAAATMLALLEQLEHSQWCTPEELKRRQMVQLGSLVRHAASHVPYYRGGPDDDPHPDPSGGRGAIDPNQWAQVPVLTRAEVQDNFDALQSNDIPTGHGEVSKVSTSGSTGSPVTVKTTMLAQSFAAVCGLRCHRWHRRDLGGRLVGIYIDRERQATYPEGLQQPGWGWPAGEIYRTGPAALLSLNTPIADQAEWLQRQRPNYLLSTPSNLLVLAEHCIQHNTRLPGLKDVATIMEVVTPEVREACRLAWDVPVVDMYTTREAGCIAVQCPDRECYHVMSEDVLVEVLDEEDLPCGPGEAGRLVVTPLHNYAMPLLRYEIGDYAVPGESCLCGRGLPVLERILGRVRNMLVLPDGRRIWPSFGRRKLVAAAPIRQYQVVQISRDTLEFRLVMDRPLTANEEKTIRASVTERLGIAFEIEYRRVDHIQRGPGGKFEEFRSELSSCQ
jgi:phenylacetate-CoA ligase